jgi:DNA-binding GntR family transcriptional regulator
MTNQHLELNRHSGVPLYRQLAEYLEQEVLERYSPGDKIESESALAARFDVHRLTVRQALAVLAKQGLVYTLQGKGTFVSTPAVRYSISANRKASFTRTMAELGHIVEVQPLVTELDADPAVQKIFNTTEPLRRTDIQRLVDGQPWSRTSTWFPPDRFEGLDQLWTGESSLYDVLTEHYGVTMQRADRTFTAMTAESSDAEWLMVPVASPILKVFGLNVDQDGEPVAVVEHRYPGDRVQWSIDL